MLSTGQEQRRSESRFSPQTIHGPRDTLSHLPAALGSPRGKAPEKKVVQLMLSQDFSWETWVHKKREGVMSLSIPRLPPMPLVHG